MTEPENDSISLDDLFAAFGAAVPASSPASSDEVKEAPAPTPKSTEREITSEIDLMAALGLVPQAEKEKQDRSAAKQLDRKQEREAQVKEQQIRSQQWKREIEALEEKRAKETSDEEGSEELSDDVVETVVPGARNRQVQKASLSKVFPGVETSPIEPFEIPEPSFMERGSKADDQAEGEGTVVKKSALEEVARPSAGIAPIESASPTTPISQQQAPLNSAETIPVASQVIERSAGMGDVDKRPLGEVSHSQTIPLESTPIESSQGVKRDISAAPMRTEQPVVSHSAMPVSGQPISTSTPSTPASSMQQSAAHMPTEVVPSVSQSHPSTPAVTPKPAAVPMPTQQPVPRVQERPVPPAAVVPPVTPPVVTSVPLAPAEPEEPQRRTRQGKETTKSNVLGIVLIVIAILCGVVAFGLLSGTFDIGTLKSLTSSSSVVSSSSAASSTAISSSTSSADEETVPAAKTAIYSYVVRGVDGGTHEAIETAEFDEDGILQQSTIEISVTDPAVAEALLDQLNDEFGDSVKSSEIGDGKVVLVLDIERDDLDMDAYTELLSVNMAEFKFVSRS